MPKRFTDQTAEKFIDYLGILGLSDKSLKNYISDISHFTSWIILKVKTFGSYAETLTESLPFIGKDTAKEYKNFLVENKTALKTINRRLSTLRHFSRFLLTSQLIDQDFMRGIENISLIKKIKFSNLPMINEFRKHLESENATKNTIKNYISDVKQFLSWLETNHAAT